MLDKLGVARALRELGALLEVKGENPFKVRAYENGARAVEGLTEDLGTLVAQGRLTEVAGKAFSSQDQCWNVRHT